MTGFVLDGLANLKGCVILTKIISESWAHFQDNFTLQLINLIKLIDIFFNRTDKNNNPKVGPFNWDLLAYLV